MQGVADILKDIIVRAGEIMTGASDIEGSGNVEEKGGDTANMVTLYDVAVQSFLIEEIKKHIPSAYFVAEEKENDEESLSREYCFIIDPIDGTANFIHDYRHSCISLAMLSCGEVVFSAVYDPYLRELFSAEKGRGAFLNGKKIRVSERDMEHSIVAFGTSPYHKKRLGDSTFKLCRELFEACSDIRRCGSAALDLAYLAAGRNDIFFEMELCPWDFAAGWLLIREAGGAVTDLEGNELDLSHSCPVIAANKVVYDELLSIVKNR